MKMNRKSEPLICLVLAAILLAVIFIMTGCSGPGGPHVRENVSSGTTASFTVMPGTWNIHVKAYLDGNLEAEGEKLGITIDVGLNDPINIDMEKPAGWPIFYKPAEGRAWLDTNPLTTPAPHITSF
jgi:hypothetical protein